MRTEAELSRIAYEIRGCGLRGHRKFGPGCFESAYSPCFTYELTQSKLEFQRGTSQQGDAVSRPREARREDRRDGTNGPQWVEQRFVCSVVPVLPGRPAGPALLTAY